MPILRLATVLAAVSLSAGSVLGDALQDWQQGIEASNRQAYTEAAFYFSRAIDLGWLKPADRAAVYYNRGRAYSALGDYDWAIEDYSHAVTLNSKFAEAFHGRAIVLELIGQRRRAIKDLQRAYALAPANKDIRQTLSALGLVPGDKFAGFPNQDRIQSIGNNSPPTRYLLHIASLRSPQDARADWRRLQRKFGDLIGKLDLVVRKVDLKDKGQFHRVLAAGSPDRKAARNLCRRLRQNGQYCAVMAVQGE